MLTLPSQGLSVLSMPPPSTDGADNGKQRQLMFINLNDQILSQILATGGKGLQVTFGGSNAVSLLAVFIASVCPVNFRLP